MSLIYSRSLILSSATFQIVLFPVSLLLDDFLSFCVSSPPSTLSDSQALILPVLAQRLTVMLYGGSLPINVLTPALACAAGLLRPNFLMVL